MTGPSGNVLGWAVVGLAGSRTTLDYTKPRAQGTTKPWRVSVYQIYHRRLDLFCLIAKTVVDVGHLPHHLEDQIPWTLPDPIVHDRSVRV